MKLAILLLLGLVSTNDVLENNDQNEDYVLIEDDAGGDAPPALPWNPTKSREEFEKHRTEAANIVNTQDSFETTKTADVEKNN